MISVIATGPLNTVQDLGRRGFRNIGVGTAGAMDEVALSVANLLVGNEENAAGIEVQTFPFELRFESDARVAVTGAFSDRSTLGKARLNPWWGGAVQAGGSLVLAHPQRGARSYVAISGGLDVPLVLGSRSTHLRNGFGGLEGRQLAKGDRLALGSTAATHALDFGVVPPQVALPLSSSEGALTIRIIRGADFEIFPRTAQHGFLHSEWKITPQSDRGGYRLQGEPLLLESATELRSYGVVPGIVQVPPSGHPIVQMADANTAGGYPRIAGVIEADLWRLAQAQIGSRLRFTEIDYPDATKAVRQLEAYLADIRSTVEALESAWRRRTA